MRELPDTCVKPWGSTGWTNNRKVEKMLDLSRAHRSRFGEAPSPVRARPRVG
jgi:hypothetical protein